MTPKVTVYIVTCNRASLLRRALLSVTEQSYPNIEIVVVDDCSDDDTRYVVESVQEICDVRYVRNTSRRGACFSRNVAIKMATGYFITGLDDDDFFSSDRVDSLVSRYTDKYSFICSGTIEQDEDGSSYRTFGYKQGEFGLNQLLHNNLVGNQVLTLTERLRALQGFDESLPAFQDYDMWVRLVERYGKALKIAQASYHLDTGHGNARISSTKCKRSKGFEMFLNKHRDKMSDSHLKSMNILRLKVYGEKYTLANFIRYTNWSNIKSSLCLLRDRYRVS